MGEWKRVKLSDLGRVVTGKTPSTKNEAFWNGSIPFVTPGDLQSTKHIFGTARYVTDDGANAVVSAVLPAGSICVSCIGVIGYVGITTTTSLSNQQINSIVVNQENDRDFVYYLLKGKWDEFKQMEGFSSVVSILNKSTFSDIEACVPDLSTQRRIAAVLGALDDKIEVNRKICENLEAQAQALFKAWFVDFEPFGGKRPEGWKMGKLGDVVEGMMNGDWGKDSPDEKNGSPVFCIRGADIPDVIRGRKGKMPLRYILPKNFAAKQLAHGNIVVEISGGSPTQSTGRSALITDSLLSRYERGMVCTNFCKAIRPKIGYSYFFYFWWRYLYDQDVFFQYENGTTGIKNLDISTVLAERQVAIPPADILMKFSGLIEAHISAISQRGEETETLAAMRDALLPKLMSGELAVEKVEVG